MALAVPVIAVAIAIAGIPARPDPAAAEAGSRPEINLDADVIPRVSMSEDFRTVQATVSPDDARQIAVEALEGLEIERMAMEQDDATLLQTADAGARLTALTKHIEGGAAPALVDEDVVFDRGQLDVLRDNPKAIPQIGLTLTGSDRSSGVPVSAKVTLALVGGRYLISSVQV